MASKAARGGPGAPGRLRSARAARFRTPRTLGRGQGSGACRQGWPFAHNLARPEGIYLFLSKTCCRLSKANYGELKAALSHERASISADAWSKKPKETGAGRACPGPWARRCPQHPPALRCRERRRCQRDPSGRSPLRADVPAVPGAKPARTPCRQPPALRRADSSPGTPAASALDASRFHSASPKRGFPERVSLPDGQRRPRSEPRPPVPAVTHRCRRADRQPRVARAAAVAPLPGAGPSAGALQGCSPAGCWAAVPGIDADAGRNPGHTGGRRARLAVRGCGTPSRSSCCRLRALGPHQSPGRFRGVNLLA